MLTDAHWVRKFRQPVFQSLHRCIFEWTQVGCHLTRLIIIPLAQFSAQLQQPCESIWPFETGATFPANIRSFLLQIFRSKTFSQRIVRRCGKRCVRKRAQQSHEQPMSMHRGMPVVTAIKRRRKFARRRHVCVAVQNMTDFIWIFLPDTRER